MKKLILAALLLATPAAASITSTQADTILDVCRTDLTSYLAGDKTYLERLLPKVANQQHRDLIQVSCLFYAKGIEDGFKIAKKDEVAT